MNTEPAAERPEVDDPRVLALAKARQQLAYENPFNAVCPPWDGLSEQEQRLSLLDARSYLYAALKAGLVPSAVPVPPPAALAAILTEAADVAASRGGCPCNTAETIAHLLRRLAAETPTTTKPETVTRTADPLAESATEYRVPVPEGGGTDLIVRRQALVHGAGWAVSTSARGGGRAWTAEGWQDSISALSVDRLFCWPDPATAVTAARTALAAEEPGQ